MPPSERRNLVALLWIVVIISLLAGAMSHFILKEESVNHAATPVLPPGVSFYELPVSADAETVIDTGKVADTSAVSPTVVGR